MTEVFASKLKALQIGKSTNGIDEHSAQGQQKFDRI